MSIAAYKKIVSVDDFNNECPDLAIHTNETILTAIYRSSEFLNFECDGLINDVWTYMSQTPTPTDTTNELYRTPTELEYIKTAIITQTSYFISNGNTNNIGSDGFSLDGFSFNQQTPTSRQALAPNVQLYLTKARVYKTFMTSGFSDNKQDEQAIDELKQLLSAQHIQGVGDNRYVQINQPLARNNSIATVYNEQVIFEPINQILQDVSIRNAENSNNILDTTNNQYTPFENNTHFLTLLAKANNNTDDIVTINANISHLDNLTQQIISGLANGGLLVLVGNYDATATYAMGNIVIYNNNLYVSIINNNTNPITDETSWKLLDYKIDTSIFVTTTQLAELQEQVDNKVDLNSGQQITGLKTIYRSGEALKIKSSGNQAKFIAWFNGNTRTGVVGSPSSSNQHFQIAAETGDLQLNASSDQIDAMNNRVKNVATPTGSNDAVNKTYSDNQYTQLMDLINNSNLFKYVGEWNDTTTYTVSQVVEHNQSLWMCKVNNVNSEPTGTNTDWLLFGTGTMNIDLSNYYTIPQTEALLQPINTDIQNLTDLVGANATDIARKADTTWVENNYYNRTYIDTNYPINNVVLTNNAQTISGAKTFSSPITLTSASYLQLPATATLAEIIDQGQKTLTLAKFYQRKAGFRNYTNIDWTVQNGSNATPTRIMRLQSQDTNSGVMCTVENNTWTFTNNTIVNGIATPTTANQAANKSYVDNAITNMTLPNTVVTTNTTQTITGEKKFTNNNITFGRNLMMGYGDSTINISSEDASNKTINWKVNNKGQLTHNFANTTRPIQNLPNPEQPLDAANKQYVDGLMPIFTEILSNGQLNTNETTYSFLMAKQSNKQYVSLVLRTDKPDNTQPLNGVLSLSHIGDLFAITIRYIADFNVEISDIVDTFKLKWE